MKDSVDVKVVQVNPLKVSHYWQLFEYGLRYSSPPGVTVSEEYINNILAGCMTGKMQCWLCYTKKKGAYRAVGTIVTRIDNSPTRGTNNLLIENIYGLGGVPGESWKVGMLVLMDYARLHGCKYVIGITHNDRVKETSKTLECTSVYSILEWEVKDVSTT